MLPQPRPRADDVENRTAGADELARRRLEHALLDPRDRLGKLRCETGQLGADEARSHGGGGGPEEMGRKGEGRGGEEGRIPGGPVPLKKKKRMYVSTLCSVI